MRIDELAPEIREMFNNKVLPHTEVRQLIARSQRGDRAATDKLVRHNMRLVYRLARRYEYAASLEDLLQEGVMGLLKAIADFDLTTNNCLSTYAQWWVVAFVKRAAQRSCGLAGSVRKRQSVRNPGEYMVSLSDPIDAPGSGELELIDAMPDMNPLADEALEQEQFRRQIRRVVVMETKDQREVAVARRIADRKDRDFELGRLGAQFGVSRERIRQIEMKVKGKLEKSAPLKRLAKAQ